VPDMQYIGEIKLFANGFIHAKILAKKMVTLYRYASELLSKQKRFYSDCSGGKTVVLNTLAESQTQMEMKTNLYTLNPKALSVIELYGTLDPLTHGDLKYASPATVSRCGMIYVDPENLDQLDLLYDRYTKNILNFIYHGLTETGQRPRMKTIVPFVQLTKLLDSLFLPLINHEKKDQLELSSDKIHAIFLQAFIWSFRVCLKQEDRIVLDIFIKYLSGLSTVSIDLKAKSGQLPNEKLLLFDYIFQPELDQCIKWNDLILKYENDRSKRFTELLVPTINTIRLGIIKTKNNIDLEWLIKSMIIIHQPVLFVGNTGSSKTATILSYIRNFDSQYTNLILNFSFRTKSMDV
ncbi:unnamed protein product, partial [Rotaria sp. Silwood2]